MHWYFVGTAALMMSGLVVLGAVAVRTDWLLPWLRLRTPRPRLWGYASMLGGTGLLLMMAWGSLNAFAGTPVLHEATWITGMLLIAAAGWLQLLSAREPEPPSAETVH